MLPEGLDYIFYTCKPGDEVLRIVLKEVASSWTSLVGFVTNSDPSFCVDFELSPQEHLLQGDTTGVYVFKNKSTRRRLEKIGVGVDKIVDSNRFDFFYSQKKAAVLRVIVRDRNKAFKNDFSQTEKDEFDNYDATVACSMLSEITITVFEKPLQGNTSNWLLNLVSDACSKM
jgi:hypothetical protein